MDLDDENESRNSDDENENEDQDQDEEMEDADGDNDGGEGEDEGDGDGENDGENGEDDGENEGDENDDPDKTMDSQAANEEGTTQGGLSIFKPSCRPEALTANTYDIVPTVAAPHSTSINVVTATPDCRWVFTGGSDGYIRRFNWVDTMNSKLMLTVAQRHPFVDSVTKAGILSSYWENEEINHSSRFSDGSSLSPVYALAVHSQALWILSGLDNGGISLQTVRHEEGKKITTLKKHTAPVSVLNLADDEKSFLSGSWDKAVLDWDLNTGQVIRSYDGIGGQTSSLKRRPDSSLPVPTLVEEAPVINDTFSTNTARKTLSIEKLNGDDELPSAMLGDDGLDGLGGQSDKDSLFGDGGSPFALGDDNPSNSLGELFDDAGDGLGGTANGLLDSSLDIQPMVPDLTGTTVAELEAQPSKQAENPITEATSSPKDTTKEPDAEVPTTESEKVQIADDSQMDISHIDEEQPRTPVQNGEAPEAENHSENVFMVASFDGVIRIWDKRQQDPLAKIPVRNTPPWCMSSCWSADGDYIYAGRRNGTVEEYSLHKGLKSVERTLKFPNGSGPVSAVHAMPNGRHLICASYDILRLYDLQHSQTNKTSSVPFLIIPGHRTGVISTLYVDPTCRFMISAAGNRGWEGATTQVLLGYEIGVQ